MVCQSFGPKYLKFQEAKDLIEVGGAFSVFDQATFADFFDKIYHTASFRHAAGEKSKAYVNNNLGATHNILNATLWKD